MVSVSTNGEPLVATSAPACRAGEDRIRNFAAFFLGDIGTPATEPVTLCFGKCTRSYVVNPATNTLSVRALVRFHFADLRADTRSGNQLILRILSENVPPNVAPILVIRSENVWLYKAVLSKKPGAAGWDFHNGFDPRFPPNAEISVYFFER